MTGAVATDFDRRPSRPAALLPAPVARLASFAALAAVAVLEWQRMAQAGSSGRALLWVLVGAAGGLAVLGTDRLPRRVRGAATLGVVAGTLVAAFAASGLDIGLLRPRRWTELGDGVGRGLEALGTVRLPYSGGDPWPHLTLELGGALLCALAGLLALWPRDRGRGFPFLSLALLLILVATPVVSLGGARPLVLGGALAALTVAFLWLERLPMRPGAGVAGMLCLAVAGALPVATMADRSDPWFDYRSFAEGLGSERPVSFDWGHDYGGITWTRDGVEIMRVKASRPSYWKLRSLDEFDGLRWRDPGFGPDLSGDPERDLPRGWEARREWTTDVQFSLRRLRTEVLPGSGTTLNIFDASRPVRRGDMPGQWIADSAMRPGDSFTARVHVPRPSAEEMAEATSADGGILANERTVRLLLDDDAPAPPDAPVFGSGEPISPSAAEVTFPPFGSPAPPLADYRTIGLETDGRVALNNSNYTRTWRLVRRLRQASDTPYGYVLAVLDHLEGPGFVYEELPPAAPSGVAPLEHFLLDSKAGYCQHYSAAMALMLRMGGVPARVATGFSPGGFSKKRQAWIVRDTDAHSWVEVWFDQFGWVAFDPTPPDTPARSQIAAVAEATTQTPDAGAGLGGAPGAGDPNPQDGSARTPGLRGEAFSNPAPSGDPVEDQSQAAGSSWPLRVAVLAVVLLTAVVVVPLWRRRRRLPSPPIERAIAELEQALALTGRPAPVGTTLRQLERRLGPGDASDYVRTLRTARYGTHSSAPSGTQRRALRRELAAGAGWTGRLRSLWALPPRLR